jgi:predicted metal-binding membrane protein
MLPPVTALPFVSARRQVALAAGLLACALAAWAVSVERMRGMDSGPGADLGTLGFFLGTWVTMTAAMMLPSAAPAVLLFARVRGGGAPLFVAGYLVAWAASGLVAYGAFRAVRAGAPGLVTWNGAGRFVAGGALAAAGLYELTPLKSACLGHCRSPLRFLLAARTGALSAGVGHGAYCVGCCAGLMVALFALGAMSIFWMAVVGGVIFAQKVLPLGGRLGWPLCAALVAGGVVVAVPA